MAGDGATASDPRNFASGFYCRHYDACPQSADDSQRAAQPEMVKELHIALDARRQRIVISEFALGTVKWVAILLQGLCTLVAIAMVHSDNRIARAITSTFFQQALHCPCDYRCI